MKTYRVLWTLGDQAVSSFNTLVVIFVAAHAGGALAVGQLALLQSAAFLLQGLQRSMVTDVLMMRARDEMQRHLDSAAASAGFIASFAALCIFAGAASSTLALELSSWWLVVALTAPCVLLLDFGRYVFFIKNRPAGALALDCSWLLFGLLFTIWLARDGSIGGLEAFLGWSGGALPGAVYVAYRWCRRRPSVAYIRDNRALSTNFVSEFAGSSLVSIGGAYAVALGGGLAAAGVVRGAQTLLGPINVIYQAAVVSVSRHCADEVERFRPVRRRLLVLVGAVMFGIVLVALLVILAFPPLSIALLGSSLAAGVESALIFVALSVGVNAMATMLGIGLRFAGRSRAAAVARTCLGPVQLFGIYWASKLAGAQGGSVAMLVGTLVVLASFAALLSRNHRRGSSEAIRATAGRS